MSQQSKLLAPGYTSADGPLHTHNAETGELMIDFSGDKAALKVIGNASDTNTSKIDKASGYPINMIWTTSDGRRIPIPELHDKHLVNIINTWRKSVDNRSKEARRVNNQSIHEYMIANPHLYPKYAIMYAEASKRKLLPF